jgi:hypothetical protein
MVITRQVPLLLVVVVVRRSEGKGEGKKGRKGGRFRAYNRESQSFWLRLDPHDMMRVGEGRVVVWATTDRYNR